MIDRFIDKCKEISPVITSKECRSMAEDIITNEGGNKHLVVRVLNNEVVKMKGQKHIPMEVTKVKAMGIDEFIGRNIDSAFLSEIRSAFKGI